jgi:hypothetical protein
MVVHFHPTYAGSVNRRIEIQASPGKNVRLHLRNNESKKGQGVAQMVKDLPSKCKVLSSNSDTTQKIKHLEE